MACITAKPAKQLGELLQEQQEPFSLDAYLAERGYVKKTINSKAKGKFGCSNGNSSMFLSCSTTRGLIKRRKASKIWKAICKNLVYTNESKSFESCDVKVAEFSVNEIPRKSPDVAESDIFSSASSTTVYDSCSEIDDKDGVPPTSMHKHHPSLTAETLRALKLYNMKEKMVEILISLFLHLIFSMTKPGFVYKKKMYIYTMSDS